MRWGQFYLSALLSADLYRGPSLTVSTCHAVLDAQLRCLLGACVIVPTLAGNAWLYQRVLVEQSLPTCTSLPGISLNCSLSCANLPARPHSPKATPHHSFANKCVHKQTSPPLPCWSRGICAPYCAIFIGVCAPNLACTSCSLLLLVQVNKHGFCCHHATKHVGWHHLLECGSWPAAWEHFGPARAAAGFQLQGAKEQSLGSHTSPPVLEDEAQECWAKPWSPSNLPEMKAVDWTHLIPQSNF